MPDQSPRLALPFIQPSQAQKHVTHNEALQQLDTLVQLTVESFNATTPPALPLDGETHALGAGASGVWAGQDGNLAAYRENAWIFITPQDGWRAWGKAEGILLAYSGGSWGTLPVEVQNIDGVGINTASDPTNRLSVASDATLFSHDGNDHQLKINKAGTGDTASLMFQTGWSGRAEIGTTGDDDFHFKVSDDGSSFQDALTLRSSNGITDAKCLRSGTITIADDSVGYLDTPSAGGFVFITMVNATYPNGYHSGIFVYDTGISPLCLTVNKQSYMQNHNITTLTGTTSIDGRTGVAAKAAQLQIENRAGSARIYSYTFIGGL